MPRYRVTLRRSSVEIVSADNPYQAAVITFHRLGGGFEVSDVRPAVGRPATNGAMTGKNRASSHATRESSLRHLIRKMTATCP